MIVHYGPEHIWGDLTWGQGIRCLFLISDEGGKPTLDTQIDNKYRLDDDKGSGPVYIEHVKGAVRPEDCTLSAHENSLSKYVNDYSYKMQKYVVISEDYQFPDYLPSPNLPNTRKWRTQIYVGDIFIPSIYSSNIHGKAFIKLDIQAWYESDPYQVNISLWGVGKDELGKTIQYGCHYSTYATRGEDLSAITARYNYDACINACLSVPIQRWDFIVIYTYLANHQDLNYYMGTKPGAEFVYSYPNKGEYSYWFGHAFGSGGNGSTINSTGFRNAFFKAQDELPRIQQNTIANIIDVVSTTIDIIRNPSISFSKDYRQVTDMWLSYRYAYNTTKSDILEAANIADRILNVGDVVKSFGSYTENGVTYHCEIVVDANHFIPKEQKTILDRLSSYGIRINMTNIWDMIPYSFVVDWFTDLGGFFESLDSWLYACKLPIKEVWYSASSNYTSGTQVYFRWLGSPPSMPSYSPHISNNRDVWLARAADIISLLF